MALDAGKDGVVDGLGDIAGVGVEVNPASGVSVIVGEGVAEGVDVLVGVMVVVIVGVEVGLSKAIFIANTSCGAAQAISGLPQFSVL